MAFDGHGFKRRLIPLAKAWLLHFESVDSLEDQLLWYLNCFLLKMSLILHFLDDTIRVFVREVFLVVCYSVLNPQESLCIFKGSTPDSLR